MSDHTDADARRRRADAFLTTGADYHRLRPGYPDDAVEWVVPAGAHEVLDLGAGTGRLTDSLVARGLSVTAVDPSESMLAVLAARHPAVRCLVGTAEALPLADDSVDAIVVGQAWHWMDPVATSAEAARVLRPGGVLAMVWNRPDLTAEWQQEFDVVQRGRRGIDLAGDERDAEPRRPFGPVEEFSTQWTRRIAAEDYLQEHTTHSLYLVAPAEEQARRRHRWRELLDGVGPVVDAAYTTTAWRFRLEG